MGLVKASERILDLRSRARPGMYPDGRGTDTQGYKGQRDLPQPRGGFDRKRVLGKSIPSDLIAEDGTRCLVSLDKFERTEPGDRVWCQWEDPTRSARTID